MPGWDMPVQYESGILQEHLATRKFGGLFDVSHMGRFHIKGKGRISFLQHVLSNNAQALEPWQAQHTLIRYSVVIRRYPIPGSVVRRTGCEGTRSIFSRSRATYTRR